MRDFQNNRRGGGRDFKRRDFDRPQTLFKTICSNCGKECEVPFKPNGSKPVFCRECFQANRSSEHVRTESFQRRPDFQDRGSQESRPMQQAPQYSEQFQALNTKLDKILNLLTIKDVVKEPVREKVEAVETVQSSEVAELPILKKKKAVKKPV